MAINSLRLQLRSIAPLLQIVCPNITSLSTRRFTMSAATSVEANTILLQKCVEENYENAVKTLNTLQSNSQTLAKARQTQDANKAAQKSLVDTVVAIEELGLSLDAIDALNIVHVAGTKGKGMTCAFTESILRHAGLKTGFFSSPHLTEVRERIRINGRPLSTHSFAKHFFTVYHRLKHLKEPNAPCEMPHYFRFLMCMAFHTFIEEKVDAVVLEVGIGGLYDSTNFIRKPVVVGISTLGMEHQSLLGNTLEEIAVQKAGIMKSGVPVYTTATHPPHILEVLQSCAANAKCPLHTVPPLDEFPINLGVDDGLVSRRNAGLAVYLANELLLRTHSEVFGTSESLNRIASAAELPFSLPASLLPFHVQGLQSTKWDGRFQVFRASENLTYFIDGAHTIESTKIALRWFKEVSRKFSKRILVFNVTGGRSASEFLELLTKDNLFDIAIFCPIVAYSAKATPDNWSALNVGKDHMEECRLMLDTLGRLTPTVKGIACESVESTINYIEVLAAKKLSNGTSDESPCNGLASVLITGSLHLVGTFLSVLDPTRNDD